MERPMNSSHRWRFCRLGGFDQVRLETAEDIRHLGELDQKLWAALSCPVEGLEFDRRTLHLLDVSGDLRVRVREVLAAVNWVSKVLSDLGPLMTGANELPLAAIDSSQPEGQQLLASARQLLTLLGKPEAEVVTIQDVSDTSTLLHNSRFNGDGIIAENAADDDDTRQLIAEVIASVGSDEDRSGLPGISQERVTAFFDALVLYAGWWEQARNEPTILPFGDATLEAAAVYDRLKGKIDDYFTRCGLAAFDPRAAEPLNPALATYETLAVQDLNAAVAVVESFPLAHVDASRPLPLREGVNPAWADTAVSFADLVAMPLFGEASELSKAQWRNVKETFAPFEAWQAAKVGLEVEELGIDRVQSILKGPGQTSLEELIRRDLELADQVEAIDNVVRLVYYNRDLYQLLNNFVSFRDFYGNERKAIFEAGTLYIDGRACELCVRVASVDTHSPMASLSGTYLAYCNCTRRNSGEQMFIAAAFTEGDADNLMVGRNGIFYDSGGKDWDATIVKLIDHPISVRQAFWSPYKRVARMAGEQIEKFAVARDKAVDTRASEGVTAAVTTDAAAPPTPFDVGKFAGIFAAIGLALGAIGTAVAAILGGFLALKVWEMPLVIIGVILAISGPSMLIAFLKLRQRNLGPILDANGWAVNTKARINIPFGSTLTKMAVLPKGAERSLADPFAEKKTPWKRWVFLLVLVVALSFAWNKGYLQKGVQQLKTQLSSQTAPTPAPASAPEAAAPAAK